MDDYREKLCWYDPRNPNYLDPVLCDLDKTPPREHHCPCDNCMTGADVLAVRIEELEAERDALQARVDALGAQITNAWKWADMSNDELRLRMGELSAQGCRDIRAALVAALKGE